MSKLIDPDDKMEITVGEYDALRTRAEKAEARLAEWQDDYRAVMAEVCDSRETYEQHCTCVPHLRKRITELEAALDAALAEVKRLREANRWIPVGERMPITRQRVIVWVQPKHGKPYRTLADYIAPRTVLAEDYLSDDCDMGFSDYDEEQDCYWTPGGYYEFQYEADMNFFIEGTVIYWRKLPEAPNE